LCSKKDKNKNKGLAILGFGMLFMGLALMSSAVKPLADNDATREMFVKFGKEPLLGMLVGLIVTLVLQSSSTVSGMIIAFATAGLLDLSSSIYLIFGTNIGTGITAILASIGGNKASKKLALGNILSTIIGAIIALGLAPLYLAYIPLTAHDIARQVANTHTIFNLFNTLLFLPLVPFFIAVMNKIVPGQDYEKKEVRHLDDHLLPTPALAIRAVTQEMIVMLDICHEMLEKARTCTIEYNHKLRNEISIDEESVDEMQKNITKYLTEITKHELTDKHRRLIPAILHSVNDLEKVGDYCESIIKQSHRAFEYNLNFSGEAVEELEKLFHKTDTLMRQTRKAIEHNDAHAASITLTIESEIDELIAQYKLNHVQRLGRGECISNAGLVFSDILTDLERLNDHLCNITKGILHIGKR
jgi:phosphate:Na+ symporter